MPRLLCLFLILAGLIVGCKDDPRPAPMLAPPVNPDAHPIATSPVTLAELKPAFSATGLTNLQEDDRERQWIGKTVRLTGSVIDVKKLKADRFGQVNIGGVSVPAQRTDQSDVYVSCEPDVFAGVFLRDAVAITLSKGQAVEVEGKLTRFNRGERGGWVCSLSDGELLINGKPSP